MRQGHKIAAIEGTRYHHGKLVEWSYRGVRSALVGSANVTAAAMLRSTAERAGNCELGILLSARSSLMPELEAKGVDASVLATKMMTAATPQPTGSGLRVLRVVLDSESTTVYVAGGDARLQLNLHWASSVVAMQRLDDTTTRGVRVYFVAVAVPAGALCTVKTAEGTAIGTVRATDSEGVLLRPGAGSILDGHSLPEVLGDTRLCQQLFAALIELAHVRPEETTIGGSRRRMTRRAYTWRSRAERAVGYELVRLALGVSRSAASGDETLFPDDRPSSNNPLAVDDDPGGAEADDVGDWEPAGGVDRGERDEEDPTTDPVSLLAAKQPTARRLARLLDARIRNLDDWPTPAVLAVLRVALVVAAGGGWDNDAWPGCIADILIYLSPDADDDDDIERARRAAGVVALAALASQIEDWDQPTTLRAWYDDVQAILDISLDEDIDEKLVAHYAEDLERGMGPQLSAAAVLDAVGFLLAASPLTRLVDALTDDYSSVRLVGRRLLEIDATQPGRAVALRVLDRCSEYAPVAVRVRALDGCYLAVWQPNRLTVHHDRGSAGSGAAYTVPIGPGVYLNRSFPRPDREWGAELPRDLRLALVREGLLDSGNRPSVQ